MKSIDVAIPVLNEEAYIKGCLDSLMSFELPKAIVLTIYILDGGSTDGTFEIASEYASHYENIIVLNNPGRIQSCAMNIVIREGSGDYILRLDAHSFYPSNYLRFCLETAERTGADNVGGITLTNPGGPTYQARLVQALTTHRFGVGNSDFRVGGEEGPRDTVPFGFFKRTVYERVGLYDERLIRAQDYEINRRIIVDGGTVWLNPQIEVYYHNQKTLAKFYKKQIGKEAPFNAYLWWVAPYAFAPRHAITGLFAAGMIFGSVFGPLTSWILFPFLTVMALYVLLAFFSAGQQAIRYRSPLHVLVLPFCFFLYHFLHGLGVIWGVLRLTTGTAPVQKKNEPWSGAGRYRAWPRK